MRLLAKIILTILVSTLIGGGISAQNGDIPDTILMLNGKKLLVNISGLTSTEIKYFPLGKTKPEIVKRKQVQTIMYKSGRREVINRPVFMMIAEGDWRAITITDKPEDVDGLFPRGKVEARSPKSVRDAKAAEKNAEIRVKKKAANFGGIVILLTKKEFKGGYGEVPVCIIEGVAYGIEPAAEQPK
ncbi:hypothetical protein [Williamwhitmania taraxaci]|uniref:Uncharacterized protein n=1 Tax=Williamwhitmania taraxaci TaxID=1640674 RepID=A0A1G6I4F6_9BACT|nr:hypothetical protein [Williamwhitmania taraxaci]SDC00935.1 hypothetical protein SAMN05216323_101442 [Williamwhitmania taraxaci]